MSCRPGGNCSLTPVPPKMSRLLNLRLLVLLGTLIGFASDLHAQASATATRNAEENAALRKMWNSWNAPFKPFRVIANVYYVGASGVSSFLITTPQGHILLDTGFEKTVPRIRESVERLGFKLADIKIILNSHAHFDHAGGHALMQKLTGAKIMISKADAALLASGGTNDFAPFARDMIGYTPARADRILKDADEVSLGGVTLTCHLTPGHTKGCTTWTMEATEGGKRYHVLFFGSTTILSGVPLVNNPQYPSIAEDFARTYRKLKALPCDVFLAPHGSFFELSEKAERLERGEPNPFVNAAAFRDFIAKAEENFRKQLAEERARSGK